MKRGCVIGYDINEKGCQISYYDDSMEENLKHVYFILLPENVTRKKNFRMSAKWHFYAIMRAVITRQT